MLRIRGSFPISLIPGRWTEACLYEITDWSERGLDRKFPEFLLHDSYVVALLLRGPGDQEAQFALWNALRDSIEPNCIPVGPETRVVRRDQWEVYLILGLE